MVIVLNTLSFHRVLNPSQMLLSNSVFSESIDSLYSSIRKIKIAIAAIMKNIPATQKAFNGPKKAISQAPSAGPRTQLRDKTHS